MFFLLCENNVQVCAFHVECNVTRDLTVDFLLYMSNFFHMHPHIILAVWNYCASMRISCGYWDTWDSTVELCGIHVDPMGQSMTF